MAFCMVRKFSFLLLYQSVPRKTRFFKVSFLFSSMSLVWSFSTVVPWLIGRGYVKANCSLVGVSGTIKIFYVSKIKLISGVSAKCQNDTLLRDALLQGPQPYSPLQSPVTGSDML